ncbi:MAG: inositol monophosphatase family protein [Hyphomonadaceae bacterium]
MPQASALLNVMIAAARKAGRALARDFGEVENLQVSKKGPADFVTAADLRSEKTLFEELSKARPGYGFLMEERGAVEGSDKTHRWIVDPLDGTLNFMHGLPHFAISIGLEREGVLVAGVIYDVIKNELFWAEKGQGAYLNDRRLRVGGRSDLAAAMLTTGRFADMAALERVLAVTPLVRRYGAAALDLAYVAAGRFDGFWERNLSPWDIAAGAVIVREAGGLAREIDGGDFMETGHILAANEKLIAPLNALLRSAGG